MFLWVKVGPVLAVVVMYHRVLSNDFLVDYVGWSYVGGV